MADSIDLDFEGVDGLLADLDEMSRIGDSKQLQEAMIEGAELTANNIRAEIPKLVTRRTGELIQQTQASKYVGKADGRLETAVVSGARTRRPEKGKEGKGAPYPIFLEYGTEDKDGFTIIKARPFMRTGAFKSLDAFVELIAEKLFGKGA